MLYVKDVHSNSISDIARPLLPIFYKYLYPPASLRRILQKRATAVKGEREIQMLMAFEEVCGIDDAQQGTPPIKH